MNFGKRKDKSKANRKVRQLKKKVDKAYKTCVPPCIDPSDWNESFQERMGWIGPFSREVFVDPVVGSDGHTYERAMLQQCLAQHNCRGKSGERLTSTMLPNYVVRSQLRDVYERTPQYQELRRSSAAPVVAHVAPAVSRASAAPVVAHVSPGEHVS